MKTTKVIDLLNKIANHEGMPKKVKWEDIIWTWNEHILDYLDEDVVDEYKGLFNEAEIVLTPYLNDEVEIIEETPKEDKKIEKLDLSDWVEITSSEDCKPENLAKLFNKNACNFSNKINEIIDKVNGE